MDVAKSAVLNGGKLPSGAHKIPELVPAIQWMSEQSILKYGTVVPEFVTVETVLSAPASCLDCNSRVSFIKHLNAEGWQGATAARGASLASKIYNSTGFFEYFRLLRTHCAQVQTYDEAYNFRHSQPKGYYDALLAACERTDACLNSCSLACMTASRQYLPTCVKNCRC